MSTPVTWDELEGRADAGPKRFEAPDALERAEELGDLFAPVLTLQKLLLMVS